MQEKSTVRSSLPPSLPFSLSPSAIGCSPYAPDSRALGTWLLGKRGATRYRSRDTTGAGGGFPWMAGAMRPVPLKRGKKACWPTRTIAPGVKEMGTRGLGGGGMRGRRGGHKSVSVGRVRQVSKLCFLYQWSISTNTTINNRRAIISSLGAQCSIAPTMRASGHRRPTKVPAIRDVRKKTLQSKALTSVARHSINILTAASGHPCSTTLCFGQRCEPYRSISTFTTSIKRQPHCTINHKNAGVLMQYN